MQGQRQRQRPREHARRVVRHVDLPGTCSGNLLIEKFHVSSGHPSKFLIMNLFWVVVANLENEAFRPSDVVNLSGHAIIRW
jgi:hypothetical protein